MTFCITGKHQRQGTVSGYITCSTEAVLQCKNSKHQSSTGTVKFQHAGNDTKDAITVPPGTPGAPIANTPRSRQNRTIVPGVGTEPYRILETAIQKKTSVRTEPQRWIFANNGIPKFADLYEAVLPWRHTEGLQPVLRQKTWFLQQSDKPVRSAGQPQRIFTGIDSGQDVQKSHPDEMSGKNQHDDLQENRQLSGNCTFIGKSTESRTDEQRKNRNNNP